MTRFLIVLSILLSFLIINAYELTETGYKWTQGAYGYHVMFKSLLKDRGICLNEEEGSTYVLNAQHIPEDAGIKRAFLIWTGAQPVDKIDEPTDNEVLLSFISSDGQISISKNIQADKSYTVLENGGFNFAAFRDKEVSEHSYFTYRVNVTDFFEEIQSTGRSLGITKDGASLPGSYTVSDLTCANDESYIQNESMVSGWAIVIVYTSYKMDSQTIQLYDGFWKFQDNRQILSVEEFEFPEDPTVKMTFLNFAGDTSLPEETYPLEGIIIEPAMYPVNYHLNDDCNISHALPFEYVETYNSISSVYGWNETLPSCYSEPMIDADTFLLDNSDPEDYFFYKGSSSLGLHIYANSDWIIPNLLVVSTSTKSNKFDIPDQPELVACTPAATTFDPENPDTKWCKDREHTFAVKVQNWGDFYAENVIVRVELPDELEYIPGSTELASKFQEIDGKKMRIYYETVPDGNGGIFPLKDGYKISDDMRYCDTEFDYMSGCQDEFFVTFKAVIRTELPLTFEIKAFISDYSENLYQTNLSIPLKLTPADKDECSDENLDKNLVNCGIVSGPDPECFDDSDCPDYFICDEETMECVFSCEKRFCQKNVSVEKGKNSPMDGTYFITENEPTIMGQFRTYIDEVRCFYKMDNLRVFFETNDENIIINSLEVRNDFDGNGLYNDNSQDYYYEPVLTSGNEGENNIWNISLKNYYFQSEIYNYLLLTADVSYNSDIIPENAVFSFSIEEDGTVFSGKESIPFEGLPITFPTFRLEPSDSIIVTTGEHNPPPTGAYYNRSEVIYDDYNSARGYNPVLQIKIKSKGKNDKLKKLTFRIPDKNTTNFGKNITLMDIFIDSNGDGAPDIKAYSLSFDEVLDEAIFEFDPPIELHADVYEYFIMETGFYPDDDAYYILQLSGLETESGRKVYDLPVNSNEQEYFKPDNPPNPWPCTILFVR